MGYNLPFPSFFSQHKFYHRKFKLRQIKCYCFTLKILYNYHIFWNLQCQYLRAITEKKQLKKMNYHLKRARVFAPVLINHQYQLDQNIFYFVYVFSAKEKKNPVVSKLTQARSKEPLVCCSTTDAVKLNQPWMWSHDWQRRTLWNSNRSPTELHETG